MGAVKEETAVKETTELVTVPPQETALTVFQAEKGLDPYLQAVRAQVDDFLKNPPALDTAKGRQAYASMAYKLAVSNTRPSKLNWRGYVPRRKPESSGSVKSELRERRQRKRGLKPSSEPRQRRTLRHVENWKSGWRPSSESGSTSLHWLRPGKRLKRSASASRQNTSVKSRSGWQRSSVYSGRRHSARQRKNIAPRSIAAHCKRWSLGECRRIARNKPSPSSCVARCRVSSCSSKSLRLRFTVALSVVFSILRPYYAVHQSGYRILGNRLESECLKEQGAYQDACTTKHLLRTDYPR